LRIRGSDFADGVIEHEALRSGCAGFATFDETFGCVLDPALKRA
jgi:predicted nucleic-acid-binding protein